VVDEGALTKGTIGTDGLDIKLGDNMKKDTDRRVAIATAAMGIA
jgi:hypothetical protein